MLLLTFTLWIAQWIAIGFSIWEKENIVFARDSYMFIALHYDGVLLEQQIFLNRKVKGVREVPTIKKRAVFVCSTMYRETREEMQQLLCSVDKLNKLDNNFFEFHIFFDDGADGDDLTEFGKQLVSLLTVSLHLDEQKRYKKFKMPYDYKLSLDVKGLMPVSIHLKDNTKIKNKKRWSQVMYIRYVLNYRIKKEASLTGDNTFILMTDADICFDPISVLLLLDMLASDPHVGAVCTRTHPQGSGMLYCYQKFEYAIGHWFQKAAEHILGCVLCCPGCFSAFHCCALDSVIEEYSTEVANSKATEFLTKDMGEDRWLCTLLVEKGWRLEYCAVSENHTHCPEDFDTFHRQRRR